MATPNSTISQLNNTASVKMDDEKEYKYSVSAALYNNSMIQSYATDTLAKTYPEASDISKAVA
jgi:hypothetical protein